MARNSVVGLSPTDHVVELAIDQAYHDLTHASTEAAQRAALERMKDLIALRSPARVLQMELDRGLR